MTPILTLALGFIVPQGTPEPAVLVYNPAPIARREVVRFSMPFPRGAHEDLRQVRVGAVAAPCVPLLRWPDGSLAVAQVHARLPMPANWSGTLRVVPLPGEFTPDEAARWHWPDELPLLTELEDAWGRRFVARLVPDPAFAADAPLGSALVRTRRYTGVHHLEDDPEQVFLGVRAYLTTFADERRAELTLLLDDTGEVGPVFGPVRFRSFALRTLADALRFRPRYVTENALHPPVRSAAGGFLQYLLGPSDQLYLGDRTGKAFRFDLYWDDEPDDAAREQGHAVAQWQVRARVTALPALDWVRATHAFGAHGGPAPSVGAGAEEAIRLLRTWRRTGLFGPFGGFGDPEDAAVQGTPRNGPSALHNVLRWRSDGLLQAAEGMVLQHCLRPSPGALPRLPEDTARYREGMSARTIERPHGFTPLDYEHFSIDLLYDYFWLTGDPLARDELGRAARGLPALWNGVPFTTARGEGWCLQAAVLISRATGQRALVAFARDRFRNVVRPALASAPRGCAIVQPPHQDAFGEQESFDAPWQMAALVHGLCALYRETDDPEVADAAVSVARVMAGPGFLDGVGPKYLVSARDPGKHRMPVGHGPLEGTALMEIGAFALAAELAAAEVDRSLFRARADFIVGEHRGKAPEGVFANPWFQIYFDRNPPDR